MQKTILTKVGELSGKLMSNVANSFNVDQSKIAKAFKFELDENEIKRIFETFATTGKESYENNLLNLG